MVDFLQIYQQQGARYQAMIEAEDFQGNLRTALCDLLPEHRTSLLDIGSGTGRLPRILKDQFSRIVALDLHRDMLLQQQDDAYLPLIQGDMRQLPLAGNQFDVVSAGWAIGHLCGWYPDQWKKHVSRVMLEMQRMVKPGGMMLIMETMSTGAFQPAPPVPWLAELYDWFEQEWHFHRQVVATDYAFPSPQLAKEHLGFFFGDELTEKIDLYQWKQIPEWTGIWWNTFCAG